MIGRDVVLVAGSLGVATGVLHLVRERGFDAQKESLLKRRAGEKMMMMVMMGELTGLPCCERFDARLRWNWDTEDGRRLEDTVVSLRCRGRSVGEICGRFRSEGVAVNRITRLGRRSLCLEEQRTEGKEGEPKT